MSWRDVDNIVKNGSYSDCRRSDLLSYLTKKGFIIKEIGRHTGIYDGEIRISVIPRHKIIKKGTLISILRDCGER